MLMRTPTPFMGETQIIIDTTHLGKRYVTGIERLTLDLFSKRALQPFATEYVEAKGRLHMIWQQNFTLPWKAFRHKHALILTPGFPPSLLLSLFSWRVVPYIHDLFLITRWQDLSFVGKCYMSLPFRLAVSRLPRFFVNSISTRDELRNFCNYEAEIILYRPPAHNVFSLEPDHKQDNPKGVLKFVALGTVEPRKNLTVAADIIAKLRAGAYPHATLDIIGRAGWGNEAEKLKNREGVTLHGYQTAAQIKEQLEAADFLITTSHDEGLGLPLLEAQYGGLPVIAPNAQVFHEVLGASGIFIDTADVNVSVDVILNAMSQPNWRAQRSEQAIKNVQRWNNLAASDHLLVTAVLSSIMNIKPIR